MNFAARIENTVWAMYPVELDKLRVRAASENSALESVIAKANLDNFQPETNPSSLATRSGERLAGTRYVSVRDEIAVIDIQGAMWTSGGWIDEILSFYFGGTSTKQLAKDIQAAIDNPVIKGIVLNINSPGGEAFGINELANLIYKGRSKKTITAYISGYGASAAYFAACGASRIVCDAQSFLGSIGVVAGWADFTGFYESLGIAYEEVVSSNAQYKRLDIRKPEERAVFMSEIDGMEKVFIDFVAKGRGVKRETVLSSFGQGAVMAGWQAVKAGLADETGDFESVLAGMKREIRKSARSINAETEGEFDMRFKDDFKAFAAKLGFDVSEKETDKKPEDSEGNEPKTEAQKPEAVAPQTSDAEQRLAKAEADLAQVKQEKLESEADGFIGAEVASGRMNPAEKDEFKSLYLQAAADDSASPLATGSRLDNLKAIQSKRSSSGLTTEQLDPKAGLQAVKPDMSETAKLEASAEQQVDDYIAATTPGKPKLEAVK